MSVLFAPLALVGLTAIVAAVWVGVVLLRAEWERRRNEAERHLVARQAQRRIDRLTQATLLAMFDEARRGGR